MTPSTLRNRESALRERHPKLTPFRSPSMGKTPSFPVRRSHRGAAHRRRPSVVRSSDSSAKSLFDSGKSRNSPDVSVDSLVAMIESEALSSAFTLAMPDNWMKTKHKPATARLRINLCSTVSPPVRSRFLVVRNTTPSIRKIGISVKRHQQKTTGSVIVSRIVGYSWLKSRLDRGMVRTWRVEPRMPTTKTRKETLGDRPPDLRW